MKEVSSLECSQNSSGVRGPMRCEAEAPGPQYVVWAFGADGLLQYEPTLQISVNVRQVIGYAPATGFPVALGVRIVCALIVIPPAEEGTHIQVYRLPVLIPHPVFIRAAGFRCHIREWESRGVHCWEQCVHAAKPLKGWPSASRLYQRTELPGGRSMCRRFLRVENARHSSGAGSA